MASADPTVKQVHIIHALLSLPEVCICIAFILIYDVFLPDNSVSCFDGIGLHYKGPVSKSVSGRECVEWDSDLVHEIGAFPKNLGPGRHNHCRRVILTEELKLTENNSMRTRQTLWKFEVQTCLVIR